jgi:outer membrane protein OmpA-like peptidoglycan-associated protein
MVLGLTMAEIVLLILFTLLLVLAALLTEKQRVQSKLEAQLALVEKEFSSMVNEHIDNPKAFFQELVLAKKKAARADRLDQQLQEEKKRNAEMENALVRERAARQTVEHNKSGGQLIRWPPIISLSEAGGYYFEVGSAELSEEFKLALADKVVPKILQIAAQYPDVDIIEVVGHTDEQLIRRRYSNLDGMLVDVLKNGDVASLTPADNVGLGIARAVAVVTRLLQDSRLQPRFSRILPMSGAQLIQVDETLTRGSQGDVRERRRIEIRLRKYEKAGPDKVTQSEPSG